MTEMPIDAPPSTNTRAGRLTEIARVFLKIGGMSYGIGNIGVMQLETQEKRQWLGKEEFVQGLALVNMLPGPPGLQLAIFLGHARGALIGGILAGLGLILPAFFIVLALSAAYVAYGALPTMRSAFYGLDTDHLANATTLVRCLEVNCRVGTLDVSVLPFFVPRLKRVISITPV